MHHGQTLHYLDQTTESREPCADYDRVFLGKRGDGESGEDVERDEMRRLVPGRQLQSVRWGNHGAVKGKDQRREKYQSRKFQQ